MRNKTREAYLELREQLNDMQLLVNFLVTDDVLSIQTKVDLVHSRFSKVDEARCNFVNALAKDK